MNKAKLNYFVDLIMAVFFIISAITGIRLYFGSQLVLLGSNKHAIASVHTYASFALVAIVAIHLILHWKWMVCMTKSFFKKKEKTCEK